MVLNVKDDARVWQRTALAHRYRCVASDSINKTTTVVYTVARYTLEPFMADAIVARP